MMLSRSHTILQGGDRFTLHVGEDGVVRVDGLGGAFRVIPDGDGTCLVDSDAGRRWRVFVSGTGDRRQVFVQGEAYEFQIDAPSGPPQSEVDVVGSASHSDGAGPTSARAAGPRSDPDVVGPASRPARRRGASHPQAEVLTVPMPARVVKVLVTVGQAVRRGEIVMKLEAMKMELPLRAPRDGTIRSIACREGELVQPGVSVLEMT